MGSSDVLFGVWKYTQKYEFKTFFWKFIGWKNPEIVHAAVHDIYGKLQPIPKHSRLQFQLEGLFQQQFLTMKKKGMKKFNFLALLSVALAHLSDDLVMHFQSQGIDVRKSQKKLEKLATMLDKVELSPVEFFDMLHNIMKSM